MTWLCLGIGILIGLCGALWLWLKFLHTPVEFDPDEDQDW